MANGQAQLFFLLCLLTTGKHIMPPAGSQEVRGTAFHFAICLIIHSAGLTLKLFLVCSQPDLFWNAARSSFPIPPPPAAAPASSFTPRKCQPPKNLSLWNNGSRGNVVTWVTLTLALTPLGHGPLIAQRKKTALEEWFPSKAVDTRRPWERFKKKACPALLFQVLT